MSTQQDYNLWAPSYDTVINPTRDLERTAQQSILSGLHIKNALELGCGTGKNIPFLLTCADELTAIDQSENMIALAMQKIKDPRVTFATADITKQWMFSNKTFHLVACSLILEHISDLNFIFTEAARVLDDGGFFYVGELHPFKQYTGSKARFENENGLNILECYIHHFSDYIEAANKAGFSLQTVKEMFDEQTDNPTPRIAAFLFRKM